METRERFAPTDMLLKNRTIQLSFVSPFFPLSLHDFGLPSIEFSACAHKHTIHTCTAFAKYKLMD